MIDALRIVALVGLMCCGFRLLREVNRYAARAPYGPCATERRVPATSTHEDTPTGVPSAESDPR
jgi:hypothetical protein